MSQPWHEEARKLRSEGMAIAAIARQLGRSHTTVRCAVDEAYRLRQLESTRQQKTRERNRLRNREQIKGTRIRIEPLSTPVDRAVQKAYADKPAPRPLSLPRISLPPIDEPKHARKFAPRTRWSSKPGVERIRAIHLKMIREGRIAAPDLVSEWVQ